MRLGKYWSYCTRNRAIANSYIYIYIYMYIYIYIYIMICENRQGDKAMSIVKILLITTKDLPGI